MDIFKACLIYKLWRLVYSPVQKPNPAAKIQPPNSVTICAWLPKLVDKVSLSSTTGLTQAAVGSLARWLPLMVAHTSK